MRCWGLRAVLLTGLIGGAVLPAAAQSIADLTPSTNLPVGVTSYGTAAVEVSGTWTGTVTFTGGLGRALNNVGCTSPASGSSAQNSTTANGLFYCPVSGLTQLQISFNAGGTGTAHVEVRAITGGGASGGAAAGSNAAAGATGAAVPASASYTGVNSGGTLVGVPGDTTNGMFVNCKTGCASAGDTVGSTVALNALNVTATVATAGDSGAGMLLAAGTLVGTIVPELSFDGGTTWVAGSFYDPVNPGTAPVTSIVFGSANTVTSRSILLVQGVSNARVRVSAFTSGTANATLRATANAGGLISNDYILNGSTTATVNGVANVALVAGAVGNNAVARTGNSLETLDAIAQTSYAGGTAFTTGRSVAAEVFTDGGLHVSQLPAMRPASYTAASSFAGSSTTDNAVIAGNASNTALVTEIMLSCTQTTAGAIHVSILKRSTADTGGTTATPTVVPDDSNYAAGASVVTTYTGTGPTAGTLVGSIDEAWIGCNATNTAGPNDVYILNAKQKPIVLRGTAQQIAINTNGAITGGNLTVHWKWIETATITP